MHHDVGSKNICHVYVYNRIGAAVQFNIEGEKERQRRDGRGMKMYYRLLVARYSSAVLPSRERIVSLAREANRWELRGEQNCWLGNRKGKVKRELIAAYDTLKRRNVVALKLGNEQTNEQPYRMKRKHRVIALLGKQEASVHATRGSGNSSNRGWKFSVGKETEKIY